MLLSWSIWLEVWRWTLTWRNLMSLRSLKILGRREVWREVWREVLLEVLLRWSGLTWEPDLSLSLLLLLVLMRMIVERFLILIEVLIDWWSLRWRWAERLLLLLYLGLRWRKSLWRLVKLLVAQNILLLVKLVLLMVNRDWSRMLLLDLLRWRLMMMMIIMERF